MRKNTKGFTLIELLAVIVILAVIALIATPIIMNVINDAKEGANKDAALGFGKAVETSIATQMIKCPGMTVGAISVDNITLTNCTVNGTAVTSLSVNYKGTKPSAVNATYSADGKLGGTVTYNNKKYSVVNGDIVS